ncbi:MAG TPA: hypothetical protein VM103_00975 [Candidatus Paceibacterota bacterium]|nr:hypothetical protein [Candidatus Paceibacterota bacterium]
MFTKPLIVIAVLVAVGYGLMEAYPLIAGPKLVLASPTEHASYPDGMVPISGTAARVVALTLNGAPLLPHEDGTFVTALAYPSGGTILTLVAKDRFGRTITTTKHIFVP